MLVKPPCAAARRAVLLGLGMLGALAWGCEQSGDAPLPPQAVHKAKRAQPPSAPEAQSSPDGVQASYTVARGGTLLNVANLYKLHHREIIDLNPKIDPEQSLQPKTRVVVYTPTDRPSESIGLPHDGSITGAMPMLEGPGRRITAERWKTWATRETVVSLDRVLRAWAASAPSVQPILIGNLSTRRGGPLEPHKTHQSGRDVDISYPTQWDGKSKVSWQRIDKNNLDASATWRLLRLLVEHADVEVMFMDRSVQRLLLAYAEGHDAMSQSQLAAWLQVAEGSDEALIRHVAGHRDHLHVRLACPSSQRRCRS